MQVRVVLHAYREQYKLQPFQFSPSCVNSTKKGFYVPAPGEHIAAKMKFLAPLALLFLHSAAASDSLSLSSGPRFSKNTLSIGRDSSGRPDYCEITRSHTACNAKKVTDFKNSACRGFPFFGNLRVRQLA